jgi:predicted Zn-dependent protease
MIRRGKVAERVRNVVLTGNVFETLMHIDAVGNDLHMSDGGPGGCGRGQQYPLVGRIGHQVMDPRVCIYDDPTRDWALGSCPMDGEGIQSRKTPLPAPNTDSSGI